jgi:hypothetical protein
MKLFNRDGKGSEEIVAAVGLISNGISFDKWEQLLPLGMRDVEAIIGKEPMEALSRFYEAGETPDDEFPASTSTPLTYLKQAVAFFTWLKIIPTLDAQHDEAGRSRRLGENEKGLTALQEFKDEENILRLAYEATDALIEALDADEYSFWTGSRKYRQREGLLIRSKEEFDEYYTIGSARLYVTLLPIIREVQSSDIAPILGSHFDAVLKGDELLIREVAARALALLTMKKAVERLPVEVIPEGIVQVNQSAPIKSRLRAEQAARESVAASLGADAKRYLEQLQGLIADLEPNDDEVSFVGPITHSKGMTF